MHVKKKKRKKSEVWSSSWISSFKCSYFPIEKIDSFREEADETYDDG